MAFSNAGYVDASHGVFQEIHGNVVVHQQGGATLADPLREKIYRWLSAPDPSSNHIDAHEKLQDSTGAWFVDGQVFSNWKNEPNSFIWIYGIRMSLRMLCSMGPDESRKRAAAKASSGKQVP